MGAKLAWLHRADDHYMMDAEYQKHIGKDQLFRKAVQNNYTKFIEYTAYEAIRKERDELKKLLDQVYAAQNG